MRRCYLIPEDREDSIAGILVMVVFILAVLLALTVALNEEVEPDISENVSLETDAILADTSEVETT